MKKRSEKEIEAAIRRALHAAGYTTEKNHQTTLNKGRPDLHVGHPEYGEAWVEVKVPGRKLRDSQVTWMLKWEGIATIIVCDDEGDVLQVLREWDPLGPRGTEPPREQWLPWATSAQRVRLAGGDPLRDALSEFEG